MKHTAENDAAIVAETVEELERLRAEHAECPIPPEEGHSSGGTGHDWMTDAEQQEAYRTRPIPPGVGGDRLEEEHGRPSAHAEAPEAARGVVESSDGASEV